MKNTFTLVPGSLTVSIIQELLDSSRPIALESACLDAIEASRNVVDDILAQKKTVYGINTGFGLLANKSISEHELTTLQRNLLLSHAAGTGELLPDEVVKLILLLKINSLARGYSGVRRALIDALIAFYNHEIYPCVPSKGSVGASGDLAPLAHLSLPLIGEGTARHKGRVLTATEALEAAGLKPLELAPKEGLALINGTQVSTGIALWNCLQAQTLFTAASVIGAMTVEGAAGSDAPFHEKIHEIRGQAGQIKVAHLLRNLLAGSPIRDSHRDCARVQDPYSLRCQPQILGASLDNLCHAMTILVREANAVSDNPLVFPELQTIMSGGNFHAEPVAQVADLSAIALAEVGALAERRIALLIDPQFNGSLAAFLVPNSGVNSGFMIAHVTAAALASANKTLAHPASVDSLPTSANQEDHVSMATWAAMKLSQILENVHDILTIELLAAAQAIELRRPLKTSPALESLLERVREVVPFWGEDRFFAKDIEACRPVVLEIGRAHFPFFFD